MVAPRARVFRPLVKGSEASGNEIAHDMKKDGDWCIHTEFVAQETPSNANEKVQKSYEIFKRRHNVLSTETNVVKIWLSLCAI